ncbi:hypothetical protein B9Z55_003233 [Caenorhabditis nigoni]|uniref:Saposin B-type domain-containing protein n=1 Tax=Caenorhabditis nigoni TaxID=1611254 RepID=A0A2G5VP39_9PELO|nr:hypothetical protein B9Z55_003233 [Caenorhabditis nigoni]
MKSATVILLLLLVVAVMETSGATGHAGSATRMCLRKMTDYANAICEGRKFVEHVDELIVAACETHVDINDFMAHICPEA